MSFHIIWTLLILHIYPPPPPLQRSDVSFSTSSAWVLMKAPRFWGIDCSCISGYISLVSLAYYPPCLPLLEANISFYLNDTDIYKICHRTTARLIYTHISPTPLIKHRNASQTLEVAPFQQPPLPVPQICQTYRLVHFSWFSS